MIHKEKFYTTHSPLQPHFSHKEQNSLTTIDSPMLSRRPPITLQLSFVHQIFEKVPQGIQLSSKITKRCVSWLIQVCWQKNYSFQSCWTALTLFYGYRRQRVINKKQLQSLLLTCLQLSTKFHQSTPLKISQLKFSSPQIVQKDLLIRYEVQLLQLFEFQIYVPHTLQTLASCEALSEEQRWKVLFLAELYLCSDDSILFDYKKCEKLIELARGHTQDCELEYLQVKKMINEGDRGIISKKYGSKFDVSIFATLFDSKESTL